MIASGFAGIGGFAKEKVPVAIPPPMAVGQLVVTYVGSPVTIVLAASGRTVEPLDFLIRRQPQLGTLSEIQKLGGSKASVVYTPRSKSEIGSDSFTFAVQSFDSPVSAAARVWVKITEVPPAFDYPHELDFGTVSLGAKSVRSLVLRNVGGGIVSGHVDATPPWAVVGPADYQIAGGKMATLSLSFTPSDGREYGGSIRVGSDPKAFVSVRGQGEAPVTVSPEINVIDLEHRAGNGFSCVLTNHTNEPRTVAIDWPEFLTAPREIRLEAGGNETLSPQIAPDFLQGFNGPVAFRSEGFVGRMMLQVSSYPAKLELAPGRVLDFGFVKSGRSVHGQFTVKNVGGTDTKLRITTPPELDVSPDPSNLILSPGKAQVFEVQLEATKGEAYSEKIGVASDSGSVSELVVKASFPKADVSTRGGQPVEAFLKMAPPSASPSVADLPLPAGSGPAVESVSLVRRTSHEIEVSWEKPAPEIESYRLERRRVMPGSARNVSIDWVPWPEARITTKGTKEGSVHARFDNMMSNTAWTFRIIAMDGADVARSRSKPFQMSTLPSNSWQWLWWVFAAIVLCGVAFLVRARSRDQRSQEEADNARIARLGK